MAKEPFIDKVIRFLEKLAWHFGIPPSEDSSLLNDGKRKPQNKRANNNPKQKGNQKDRLKIPVERLRKYFPSDASPNQMEETIIKALEFYRKRQREDRDER